MELRSVSWLAKNWLEFFLILSGLISVITLSFMKLNVWNVCLGLSLHGICSVTLVLYYDCEFHQRNHKARPTPCLDALARWHVTSPTLREFMAIMNLTQVSIRATFLYRKVSIIIEFLSAFENGLRIAILYDQHIHHSIKVIQTISGNSLQTIVLFTRRVFACCLSEVCSCLGRRPGVYVCAWKIKNTEIEVLD